MNPALSLSGLNSCCVLSLLLAGASAHAAVINWGPATDTSSATDLISGPYVYAMNGFSSPTDSTPNNGGAIGPVTADFINTNYAGLLPAGVSVVADVGGPTFRARGINSVGAVGSTGDPNFDNLVNSLTDAFGTTSGITSATMTLGNLVDGQDYLIQVFFNDQRSASSGRAMIYGDGSGNTVTLAGNDGSVGGAGEFGQFAVGSFTASGTTQDLTMVTNGFGNVHYNAIAITAVPEASSIVLLGIGMTGLLVRRRTRGAAPRPCRAR